MILRDPIVGAIAFCTKAKAAMNYKQKANKRGVYIKIDEKTDQNRKVQ